MSISTGKREAARGITWNLGDLYQGIDDPAIDRDLAEADRKAEAFAATYRGAIDASLATGTLAAAMQELETLSDLAYRPFCFAQLAFAADTANEKIGALLQRVQEKVTETGTKLLFFDLAWIEVPEEHARTLMDDPALARYRHHLENIRKYRPHRLSEPEERILAELDNTGSSAFQRLFDQILADMNFHVKLPSGAADMNEEEVLTLLHDPDRNVRRAGADALTAGLKSNRRIFSFIYNNLVQDHAVHDRLRSYTDPMQSRNLANEIDRTTVDALLEACESNAATVQRYYRIKARLLGITDFTDYDRYAPLQAADETLIPFDQARAMVLDAYGAFSPDMSRIAGEFFTNRWIDAEVRNGKRGGAFSHGMVPSTHPYVFLNYTGGRRDVMTLAHELGHGVHQYLARKQGLFHADTPLTTAETASVFGEMLVFQRLLKETPDPKARLSLLCGKLEDSFATVYRQAIMTRFEQSVHAARRSEGELPVETLNRLWLDANRIMFGDAITLREDYGYWWMYIPHFIHTPFYTYAYSFGELLVLALYQKYEQEGASFVPKYLELLSAGGSESPEVLLGRAGIDIRHPEFWKGGLVLLSGMVDEVERLAANQG